MTLIGKVLAGRYEIIEEIGSGGMAVVYKAKCQLLNRFVAVKVLRPDLQNDEEFVRRFNVEAQAAASLTHPNIVSIYDVGNEDGLHYIVMEYIEGKTLKEYIEEKRILPWREAVDYTIQIAKGLEQAHKNSIIHRDVKPHNIIMTADKVMKVTDFGIARANVQSTVTCEDNAIGSVHYISPEQARGGYTDERSDIYSLGVVLYEMITGTVPFDSERPVAVAIMHLQDKPIAPREHNISIPRALENVVLKAMTKEISARHKSASEFIEELTAVLNDPTRLMPNIADEKPKTEEMGTTIIMPAVKPDDYEEPKPEKETVSEPEKPQKEDFEMPARKKPANAQQINKKKERKVIAIAIVCAIAVLGLLFYGFWSFSGIGSLLAGSGEVEIPDIVGMTLDEARQEYVDSVEEGAEFKFNIIESKIVESDQKEGTIIGQNPKAGDKVRKGETVTIYVDVSKGRTEIQLKDYTKNKDFREAEIDATGYGLKVEIIKEFSDEVPKDAIIRQVPVSGSYVKKGDTVTFYVSDGPEKSEEDARNDGTIDIDNPPVVENPSNTDVPQTNSNPEPVVQKKSTNLTIYGPKDKESALVQIYVDGKLQRSRTMKKGESVTLKVEGTSDYVEIEILHDGVSQQKGTVQLH